MTAIRNVGESQRAAQRDMGHGAAKWGLEGDVSDEGCAPVGGVTRRNETLLGQIVTSGYFVSGLGCR